MRWPHRIWPRYGAMLKPLADVIRFMLVVLAIGGGCGVAFAAPATSKNMVSAIRLGPIQIDQQAGVRVVIETSRPMQANLSLLRQPYRLVIDMPDTDWDGSALPTRGVLPVAPALRYRFGKSASGVGRLVIELDRPAAPVRVFPLAPRAGGHRFVVDLIDRGETAFLVAAAALDKNPDIDYRAERATAADDGAGTVSLAAAMPVPLPKPRGAETAGTPVRIAVPKPRPRRWIVFIDAGHGGKDPGAIGRRGTQEKTITLGAARELARQLKATGKVVPVLARNDDRFLRLRERIQLARQNRADIFISLHADSARASRARGISVFTLSDKASDKEAAALARKENKADLIGGPDLAAEDPDAAGALVRMFQRESMNQSSYLAAAILRRVIDLPGGDKRGHRFAGFAVLKAPDIPSVLVEMGFLSNRQDESNLRKKDYQRDLSRRLTAAILDYLAAHGPRL